MQYILPEILAEIVSNADVPDVVALMMVNTAYAQAITPMLYAIDNLSEYIIPLINADALDIKDNITLKVLLWHHVDRYDCIVADIYAILAGILIKHEQYVPVRYVHDIDVWIARTGKLYCGDISACKSMVMAFSMLVPEYAVRLIGEYLRANPSNLLNDFDDLVDILSYDDLYVPLHLLYDYAIEDNGDILYPFVFALRMIAVRPTTASAHIFDKIATMALLACLE